MTSVDKNREHTLVEEPFQQRFDEKPHIRTQNKSMPFSPLMNGLSVRNQPLRPRYKRLVHLQRFDNGLDVLDPSPVLAPV